MLVVDDEPLNCELLKRVLYCDYDIEVAGCVTQALEVLEHQDGNVQLILCDQLMPGRKGTELAKEVAARWPHVRIILLTGFDDDDEVLAARKQGWVSDVVAKPWRSASLRIVVKEALQQDTK